jgi:hypothetical protein
MPLQVVTGLKTRTTEADKLEHRQDCQQSRLAGRACLELGDRQERLGWGVKGAPWKDPRGIPANQPATCVDIVAGRGLRELTAKASSSFLVPAPLWQEE